MTPRAKHPIDENRLTSAALHFYLATRSTFVLEHNAPQKSRTPDRLSASLIIHKDFPPSYSAQDHIHRQQYDLEFSLQWSESTF